MGQWQPSFKDVKQFLDEMGYKKTERDSVLLGDIKEHIQEKYEVQADRKIVQDYIKIWRAMKKN